MNPGRRRTGRAWLASMATAMALLACALPGRAPAPDQALLQPSVQPSVIPTRIPAPTAASGPGPATDVVFHNAVILTMDEAQPRATAIHIRGEKIVALGSDAEVLAGAGAATQVIDLKGMTLMPGFIDSHTHLFHGAAAFGLNDVTSQDEALGFGVTSIGELWADQALVEHLKELDAAGGLRLRTSVYPTPYNDGCGNVTDQDWYRAYPPGADLGPHLRVGGIKIYTDGGGCNAPAVSFEYAGGAGHGSLYFTQEELDRIVARFHGEGYQLAIHAIGDRAIEQALNAVAAAQAAEPREVHHRLEHVAVVRPDLMQGFEETGAVAVMFGGYPTCWLIGETEAFVYATPNEYLAWEWPRKTFLETAPGAHVAYHSDAPGVRPIDTFTNLHGMVTRQEIAEDGSICRPPAALAANAIPVEDALRAMTIEGAYALGQEAELGTLTPGKLADLIVLVQNPLEVSSEQLRTLGVVLTMVGGQTAYCAPGYDAFCPEAPTPGPAILPAPETSIDFRDEFSGALDSGWAWSQEDPSAWSLETTPGWLRIVLSTGGYLSTPPSNVLLRPAPAGDFELRTTVRVSPSRNFEFAGLIVAFPDGQVLQFGRAYCDVSGVCTGSGYYFDHLSGGSSIGSNHAFAGLPGSQHGLRLQREGSAYSAYYLSLDGEWISIGTHVVDQAPSAIGLIAAQAPNKGPVAEFDYFEIRSP